MRAGRGGEMGGGGVGVWVEGRVGFGDACGRIELGFGVFWFL